MEERPKFEEIYMNLAIDLAKRGTCLQVGSSGKLRKAGAVITSGDFKHVLAVGYNGNYAGGPNKCDDPSASGDARCGCIHAEMNALVKCDNRIKDKVMFITSIPCSLCSKLIINSGFSRVYVYLDEYTEKRHDGKNYDENIAMLISAGVKVFGKKEGEGFSEL